MTYNFSPFKDKLVQVLNWLRGELSVIRTGQATPAILDLVKVEAYGQAVPVKEVASISVEDTRTLRVTPWDANIVKDIEHAMQISDLGLAVSPDDMSVRVTFPALTEERRISLIKIANEKLGEAKVRARKEREQIIKDLVHKEKDSEISEDELKRYKNEVQKLIDDMNKKLDEAAAKKEKEISV